MKSESCESCLMPFSKDPGRRESEKYCSYCFNNGTFTYEGDDVKVFQKMAYEGMKEQGMNSILAWFYSFLIRFAPRWKKK